MKVPVKLAWAATAVAGVAVAVTMTYRGYKVDELGTSGAPTTGEISLSAVFLALLVLAIYTTVAGGRRQTMTIPASHIVIAFFGAVLGVLLWPAVLIPVGIIGYHLLRRPESTMTR